MRALRMSLYSTIGQLFEEEPIRWGLRGDPFLWRKMRDHFSDVPLPANAAELEKMIAEGFFELSGQPMSYSENFRVNEFAHGGMSSGAICPEFWRDSALPLLRSRHSET